MERLINKNRKTVEGEPQKYLEWSEFASFDGIQFHASGWFFRLYLF